MKLRRMPSSVLVLVCLASGVLLTAHIAGQTSGRTAAPGIDACGQRRFEGHRRTGTAAVLGSHPVRQQGRRLRHMPPSRFRVRGRPRSLAGYRLCRPGAGAQRCIGRAHPGCEAQFSNSAQYGLQRTGRTKGAAEPRRGDARSLWIRRLRRCSGTAGSGASKPRLSNRSNRGKRCGATRTAKPPRSTPSSPASGRIRSTWRSSNRRSGRIRPIDAQQLGQAIAAFERSLVAMNSPFDRFRAGDANALTAQQRRGLAGFRRCRL